MIGIVSAPAAGDSLPGTAASSAGAGVAAADAAFDEVFRQLTGALLVTAAGSGTPAAAAEADPVAAGPDAPPVESDKTATAAAVTVMPAQLEGLLPVPAPQGIGNAGGDDSDGGSAIVDPGTRGVPHGAPGGQAGTSVTARGGGHEFEPAEEAGTGTASTEVAANVRGLERRRGMRETPARARTFEAHPSEASVAPSAGPQATETTGAAEGAEAPVAAGASAGARPTGWETPAGPGGHSERAFALHRALARQQGATGPGLSTQASAGHAGDAATPDGRDPNARGGSPDDRSNRLAQARLSSAAAANSGGPAHAAGPAALTHGTAAAAGATLGAAEGEVAVTGAAGGATWSAALADASAAEALGSSSAGTDAAGPAASAVTVLGRRDWPDVRESGPLTETALPASDLDEATAASVQAQIVKSIRLQWHGGSSEARVLLKPEYLGEVAVTIKVEQGAVTATLQADTPEVRRWMESHTATLRDGLGEHGLRLDRLTVAEPERQEAHADRHARPRQRQQDGSRQRARRQTADPDSPFDVTTE